MYNLCVVYVQAEKGVPKYEIRREFFDDFQENKDDCLDEESGKSSCRRTVLLINLFLKSFCSLGLN